MIKHRAKILLAVVFLTCGMVLVSTGLGALGSIVEYFGSGSDPAKALWETPLATNDPDTRIDWLPDNPQPVRQLEPETRRAVADALVRAFRELEAGTSSSGDYFTGPARVASDTSAAGGVRYINHAPALGFYSADGQIVILADEANVARAARLGDGRTMLVWTREQYQITLLLSDGNWRVRTMHRTAADEPVIGMIADPLDNQQLAVAVGALLLSVPLFMPNVFAPAVFLSRRGTPQPTNEERH